MADLLLDITTYLTSQGLAQGDGVDVFRDFAPDTPDDVVVLSEYGGAGTATGVEAVERFVQVKVRSLEPGIAKQKAWDIFNVLDVPLDRVINLTQERWSIITARQTPFKLQVDSQNRVSWAFNLWIVTYRD